MEAKLAETAKIPTVSKPANPGLLPQVTLTAVEYKVDPFALNRERDNPPFEFRGGAGIGRVIDRQGKVLLESGEDIGISGAVVSPDKKKVLVMGGDGKNVILEPAKNKKITPPFKPPGNKLFPFNWHWIGPNLLFGISGVEKVFPEGPHENCYSEDNLAQTKLYTFDLLTNLLSEVIMPAAVTQPVVHAVEVMSDGHIHLVQDEPDGSRDPDLGWFKVEGSK